MVKLFEKWIISVSEHLVKRFKKRTKERWDLVETLKDSILNGEIRKDKENIIIKHAKLGKEFVFILNTKIEDSLGKLGVNIKLITFIFIEGQWSGEWSEHFLFGTYIENPDKDEFEIITWGR